MKKTHLALILLLPLAIAGGLTFVVPQKASAYDSTDYLMDDSVFRNAYTMDATQILNFLQQEGSGLSSFQDVYVCGYPTDTNFGFYNQHYDCNVAVKDTNGNTYYETQPQSAALIIAEASQAYGINPQAVLATMQKEQSLVTTPNPTASQLNFAMGFACPDSGGCGGVSGFFNQVDNGTWQFRYDVEAINGNTWWGLPPSDYPCNGQTRYYSQALKTGNDVHFYDDYGTDYTNFVLPNASTSALYCYTPHVFPGSSREYYSGSYWFDYYFSLWFGSNTAPYAFQGTNSSTIYFYINGNKVAVNAMGTIQDYGVSPQSIHTLSQSTVNSIPAPNDGTSASLNYLVEAPSSSTIYLVSLDKRYQVQSTAQLTSYGFSASNVSIEPASFINSIPNGGTLSNFISSPYGNIFNITSGQKKLIYDYSTYIGLNPSDQVTPVSYFLLTQIPTGAPLSNRDILVQYQGSDAVYLFLNANYYQVPTFDVYNCWGFESNLGTPIYQLPDNSYIPTINSSYSLNCLVGSSGTVYLMGNGTRYTVPSSYGISSPQTDNSDVINLALKVPSGGALKQYIKPNDGAGVWYLTNGVREVVPTLSDYNLLGLNPSQIEIVDDSAFSSITASGIKLGSGQVVKTTDSSAVYVISGTSRLLYATSDDFLAYENSWSNIEAYSSATLDAEYAYNGTMINKYFYDQPSNTVYLMDPNGCYSLNSSQLNSYGQNQSQIASTQSYTKSIFPGLNLANCQSGSTYVNQPGQPAVYWINNGEKYAFSGWNSLVTKSGTNTPYIISLSASTLQTFPTGPPI